MICDKGEFGVGQGDGVLSSFGWPRHSLFRMDQQETIGGNGPQGSISVPQGSIRGFFNSSIEMITIKSWSLPDASIAPVTTSDARKMVGLSLNHPDATIHKNNENHQSIKKILRLKLLKCLKALNLKNFPPKTLRTFVCYKVYSPNILNFFTEKQCDTYHWNISYKICTRYNSPKQIINGRYKIYSTFTTIRTHCTSTTNEQQYIYR